MCFIIVVVSIIAIISIPSWVSYTETHAIIKCTLADAGPEKCEQRSVVVTIVGIRMVVVVAVVIDG